MLETYFRITGGHSKVDRIKAKGRGPQVMITEAWWLWGLYCTAFTTFINVRIFPLKKNLGRVVLIISSLARLRQDDGLSSGG